jgi:PAS domain S-box-containing protein
MMSGDNSKELPEDSRPGRNNDEWKFRAIFDQHFQLMGILSTDGIVLEANRTSLALVGADEADVKGMPFWDTPWWTHSLELQSRVQEAVKRAAAGEEVSFEVTHPGADGTLHYVQFSLKPVKDDAGKVMFLVPEGHDVTEQKMAEQALKEAALKYRIVADNTYNWECWLDPDGRYIYSSPSCERITGHRAEELMAERNLILSLIHPDDLEMWMRHRHDLRQKKELREMEVRISRDGKTRWLHHVCLPIYNEDGDFLGTRSSFEDITERKEAEQKNVLLAAVVECSDDAIFASTVDGIITSWNRGAERIFGYTAGEVIGNRVTMLFPQQRRDNVLRAHERIRHGEHIEHFEAVSKKKDGELIDMSLTYSPIRDDRNEVVAIAMTGRDITAQKRAAAAVMENARIKRELELHEKELLLLRQSRLAAMGEMIGNIAHQWRQPLNMLGLCIQEVAMIIRKGECTEGYVEESVKKMMETIRHMSKTIDDFRDFTRLDKEKMDFHVLETIHKTISLQESSLNTEQIRIEVVADCDCVISGYPNEFSQVLLNIMMNAQDALVRQQVPAPVVTIRAACEDGKCVVTITDNAGGIPEAIIDKIFDPYFTTKEPDKGTGIGLYMSKTIVEKNMGGTLSARNVHGGAEFRIVI